MSASTLQLLRQTLLMQLSVAYPASIPLEALHQGALLAGHALTPAEALREVAYLIDRQLLSTQASFLNPAVCLYRLTATGKDYLSTQGLT